MNVVESIQETVAQVGWMHVRGACDLSGYRDLASTLGEIVSEEVIAIRPGAHAYVAKPGPVPLHTDHPEVETIAWFCERQDNGDGASLIFDTKPVIEALPAELRHRLRSVGLRCPHLAGGPPVLCFPVLTWRGDRDDVFCSPWLHAASEIEDDQRALDEFRGRISAAAKREAFDVRLQPGDILVVDNRRMLHGRRAIAEQSGRRLHRTWMRTVGALPRVGDA